MPGPSLLPRYFDRSRYHTTYRYRYYCIDPPDPPTMIMTSPPSPSPPPPVSSRTNNPNNSSFKNPFSSGLGRVSFVFTAKNDVIGVELPHCARRYRCHRRKPASYRRLVILSATKFFPDILLINNLIKSFVKGGSYGRVGCSNRCCGKFLNDAVYLLSSTCINYQMDLALTLTARVHTRRHGIITTIKKIPQSPFRKQSKNHGMHKRRSSSSSSRMPRLLRVRVVNNNNNIPMEIGSKSLEVKRKPNIRQWLQQYIQHMATNAHQ